MSYFIFQSYIDLVNKYLEKTDKEKLSNNEEKFLDMLLDQVFNKVEPKYFGGVLSFVSSIVPFITRDQQDEFGDYNVKFTKILSKYFNDEEMKEFFDVCEKLIVHIQSSWKNYKKE
jgi:hypothetical protein